MIDTLDALELHERPIGEIASVQSDQVVISAEGRRDITLPLPEDEFYLSVAPCVQQTHECFFPSTSTTDDDRSHQRLLALLLLGLVLIGLLGMRASLGAAATSAAHHVSAMAGGSSMPDSGHGCPGCSAQEHAGMTAGCTLVASGAGFASAPAVDDLCRVCSSQQRAQVPSTTVR